VVRPATALAGRTTTRRRRLAPLVPYALLAPALLVLAAILGFPMYRLVTLSFQQYGLKELFAGRAPSSACGTTRTSSATRSSGRWWPARSPSPPSASGLTMGLGTLVALLLRNLGRTMRVLVTAGLVAAWAMPTLTAISIWQWMFDFEFGVVNWLLTSSGSRATSSTTGSTSRSRGSR
jgi:N,N'-diacetylchitobiose transport system permease protein